jgi:hypothetical protein
LDLATKSFSAGQRRIAGEHWRLAFENVDILVIGQYHDILPNIIKKINDLKSEGCPEVAAKLHKYLMKSAAAHNFRGPTRSIRREPVDPSVTPSSTRFPHFKLFAL